MPPDTITDPYRAFNFRIDIDNMQDVGAFSECSGLTSEGQAVDYREGTDPLTVRKLIGLRTYSNITLKRGYTRDSTLWDWYKHIASGIVDRRNGSIVLLDELHEPLMYWHFKRGWINKIDGPSLNASGNEVAIESIEIVHEGLTMELAPGSAQ